MITIDKDRLRELAEKAKQGGYVSESELAYALRDPATVLALLDAYEDLQAERDQQYFMKVRAREQRDAVTAKLKSLQAECEKLRKDAERYRWLRADALSAYEDDLDEPQLVYARECVGDYQDCIDAAIDAAMQEGQP